MAGSVNKVILVGNLGRDPEVRHTQDGSKVVHLSVATSESWKDRGSGERKERTEWHRVVIFNDRVGEIAERYLRKGSKVYLEGALQSRKWTGQDGQERYTTEVVLGRFRGELTLLDARGEGAATGYGGGEPSYEPMGAGPGGGGGRAGADRPGGPAARLRRRDPVLGGLASSRPVPGAGVLAGRPLVRPRLFALRSRSGARLATSRPCRRSHPIP